MADRITYIRYELIERHLEDPEQNRNEIVDYDDLPDWCKAAFSRGDEVRLHAILKDGELDIKVFSVEVQ